MNWTCHLFLAVRIRAIVRLLRRSSSRRPSRRPPRFRRPFTTLQRERRSRHFSALYNLRSLTLIVFPQNNQVPSCEPRSTVACGGWRVRRKCQHTTSSVHTQQLSTKSKVWIVSVVRLRDLRLLCSACRPELVRPRELCDIYFHF